MKIFDSFCAGTFALTLVPGQRDTETGFLFVLGERDTGTGFFFVSGQRDNEIQQGLEIHGLEEHGPWRYTVFN